jgi:acetyl esterase/lipase
MIAGPPTAPAGAQTPAPAIERDGAVNVPAFVLPPSPYLSEEARKALPKSARDDSQFLARAVAAGTIPRLRETMAKISAPAVKRLRETYPVTTEPTIIAGVKAVRIRPTSGVSKANRGKVLINLPGGAFLLANAEGGGLVESIPVAALTGVEVISLTYSQAPEARFPAASRDVEAVYRDLLKTHRARDIGLFGCSAGGLLTAQSLAWLQKAGLPRPGAAGIFCASADARWSGDSWSWQRALHGLTSEPTLDERAYYGEHDLSDPLMSPIASDAVLARFPPTLLITATRAGELSSTVDTHRRLVRAGVEAQLHVWDGLDHGFYQNPDLPESKEAYDVMARFFRKYLGMR